MADARRLGEWRAEQRASRLRSRAWNGGLGGRSGLPTPLRNPRQVGVTWRMPVMPEGEPEPWAHYQPSSLPDVSADDPVTVWEDTTGNGRHLVEHDTEPPPRYVASGLNGLPGIKKDPSSWGYLTHGDFGVFDEAPGLTVFAVSTGDSGGEWVTDQRADYVEHIADWILASASFVPAFTVEGPGPAFVVAYRVDPSAGSARLWADGDVLDTETGIEFTESWRSVGWHELIVDAGLTAFHELVIYDRPLADGLVAAKFTQLHAKYGIT